MKTITLKDLNKTKVNTIAHHYGKNTSKNLLMASNPATGGMAFLVEKNHCVILETVSIEVAVEKYNGIS